MRGEFAVSIPADLVHVKRAGAEIRCIAGKLKLRQDDEIVFLAGQRLIIAGSGDWILLGIQLHRLAGHDEELGDDSVIGVFDIDDVPRKSAVVSNLLKAQGKCRQSQCGGSEQGQR